MQPREVEDKKMGDRITDNRIVDRQVVSSRIAGDRAVGNGFVGERVGGSQVPPRFSLINQRIGVLANQDFFLLWLGQAVSTFGDKFTELAIPILVYQVTGSPFQLGLAFLASVLSSLLFGLAAGVLSDHWDRRWTMVLSDLGRAAIILAIPLVINASLPVGTRLALLYGMIFLTATLKQFFLPAKIAAIPEIVAREQLMEANSLDQSAMKLMEFAGYAMAGVMIQLVGASSAFIIDAGTFLFSAIVLTPIRIPLPGDGRVKVAEPILSGIKAGLVQVRQKPLLWGTLLMSALAPLSLGATSPLLIVFSDRILGVGATGYAALQASFGLGLAIGVVVVSKLARDAPRARVLVLGVIGMGLTQLLAFGLPLIFARGLLPGGPVLRLAVTLPLFFLSATANGAIFLGMRTIVQENTPRSMTGRVFSLISVISNAAMALGAALAGIAGVIDVGTVLLFWSFYLVAVGLIGAALKPLRQESLMPELVAADPPGE